MRGIIIFSFLLCTQMSLAQVSSRPAYPDAGLWTTFNLTYKFAPKTTFLFTQEMRLRENYSRLNLFYTNLGVSYAWTKKFKTALIYRHIDKYLIDNTFSFRHRLMLDASYKWEVKKLEMSYRHRAQMEFRDVYSSALGKIPELFSRHKLEFGYPIGRFTPNFSTELRIQFTDPRNNADDDNISRNRNIIGLDYEVNKFATAGAYFLYQSEFNTVTPQIIYITGLEYKIDLSKYYSSRKSKQKSSKKSESSNKK